MKLQLDDTRHVVDSEKAEQQKLQRIVADGDAEQLRLNKQVEQVDMFL